MLREHVGRKQHAKSLEAFQCTDRYTHIVEHTQAGTHTHRDTETHRHTHTHTHTYAHTKAEGNLRSVRPSQMKGAVICPGIN